MTRLILIAEDEFGLAEAVAQVLVDHGHEAELAINGAAALDLMAGRRPDLALIDVMMPVLDGPGLVHRMRDDESLRDVPVVLMTALPASIPPDINALVQGLLTKPFTPQELLGVVERLLSRE